MRLGESLFCSLSVHHLLQQSQFFLGELGVEVLCLHVLKEGLGFEETAYLSAS
ncbi:MAG: hypothetical protein U0L52_09905 [Bacteroidaceae bacterium]|nr:hypothetical protein [Bacteroidaceae bacterium]